MYWEEDKQEDQYVIPDDVIDLVFTMDCRCLPVEHAYALSQAVQHHLPWFAEESQAALHTIHGAASGNGWVRPEDPNALLHLSRRTRFMLRVPKHRIEDAKQLQGQTLDIDGHQLNLKQASLRPLSDITTLFTRALAVPSAISSEEETLDWVMKQLKALDIHPRKMLCGTEHFIQTPNVPIQTRSLMIADLEVEESVRLQMHGIGLHRELGCGVFIPHKDINEVNSGRD
jgi:CRISPR-associated protein Cas6